MEYIDFLKKKKITKKVTGSGAADKPTTTPKMN